ncbi:MAG: tetratricopeptide repeat protein [Gemmataceae bacterium]
MAVPIEGYSVLVRNSTLIAKYPGGVDGYRRDCPNNTFCADECLSRIGFMVQSDADVFVAQLAARGLMPYRNDVAEDVALATPVEGSMRPCAWLELGRWGQVVVAWLAGTKRGDLHAPAGWNAEKPLRQMSEEEIEQRLEFLRSEDNVDVYRDKTTGQQLYVGRTASISEEDKSRHNDLYEQGCRLIEGLILVHNKEPGELDPGCRKRLRDAIPLFVEVVRINPGNWATMWLLGKVYQRLGEYEQGLAWFSRAHRVNPDQADVAREAAIAAMDLGRPEEAISFCSRAIEVKPDDPGLRANLALALLFAGKPAEARPIAQEALAQDPVDKITAYLMQVIEGVLGGTRPCPHHTKDLQ